MLWLGSGQEVLPCSDCIFQPLQKGKDSPFAVNASLSLEGPKDFQADLPHRLDPWGDLEPAKLLKPVERFAKVQQKSTCSQCGTTKSAYDLCCRDRGQTPRCDFVERHMEVLIKISGVE